VILTEPIDSQGVTRHFVIQDETLCIIAKRKYGDTKSAINLAWFNGIDHPDFILVRQVILLPADVSEIPIAPSGWPEVQATPEQIRNRTRIVPRVTESNSPVAAPAAPQMETVPATQQQSRIEKQPVTCATSRHIVAEDEVTYQNVVQNDIERGRYDPELAPASSHNRRAHPG
jgi:hypothetical protein